MPGRHVVEQGDCISSICSANGFSDWRTVFDHPDNADLKKKRKNPNQLLPGDVVVVPDKEPKPFKVATGQTHRFKVKLPLVKLRVVLRDGEGKAIADKPYSLDTGGGGAPREGQTGSDGLVEELVPAEVETAKLTVRMEEGPPEKTLTWTLRVGHLDPVTEVSGVQGRLRNLGLDPGSTSGELDEPTRRALRAFQLRCDLPVTGELDDDTRDALEKQHDAK